MLVVGHRPEACWRPHDAPAQPPPTQPPLSGAWLPPVQLQRWPHKHTQNPYGVRIRTVGAPQQLGMDALPASQPGCAPQQRRQQRRAAAATGVPAWLLPAAHCPLVGTLRRWRCAAQAHRTPWRPRRRRSAPTAGRRSRRPALSVWPPRQSAWPAKEQKRSQVESEFPCPLHEGQDAKDMTSSTAQSHLGGPLLHSPQ